jgi:hypothetical protein
LGCIKTTRFRLKFNQLLVVKHKKSGRLAGFFYAFCLWLPVLLFFRQGKAAFCANAVFIQPENSGC